jgi:hypothetical protein
MKKLILIALLFAATSAHAKLPSPLTPFTPPKTAVKGNLTTLTINDLQSALASANAQTNLPNGVVQPPPFDSTVTGGDTRHGNCWAALIRFASGIKTQQLLPSQMGLATLQQTIFNDQQLVGRPLLPDYVVTNCALTLNDANMNFVQIINALGLTAIAIPKIP